MAKKSLINEEAVVAEAGSTSAAGATVHAGSKGGSLPKDWSNTGQLANMIGAARAVKDEHLVKFYDEMIARAKELGHGVGVGNNSEANKSSTDTTLGASSGKSVKQASGAGVNVTHVANPLSTIHGQPQNHESFKEIVRADVEKILSEEGLTEEFKTRAATLFEAALEARVIIEQTRIEEEMQILFVEELEDEIEELKKGIDTFLDASAEEWMKDNEVAIESSLRNEIATDIIDGLRKVFSENNVNVPEEQVDVIETMSQKIDELEARLNDAITENANLSSQVEESAKATIIKTVSEGLTLVEAEKLKGLVENIDADTIEEFETKVKTIKESQFVKGAKQSVLSEGLEEAEEGNAPVKPKSFSSPVMKAYAEAISRSVRK